MSNEEFTQSESKKKNNGWLIGCGCLIGAIIIGIAFVSLIIFFITSAVKSAVEPNIDKFFEKYNNNEINYICSEMLPEEIPFSTCQNELTKMKNSLGKEKSYNLSLLSGAYIKVESHNGETTQYIKMKADFEEYKNVKILFNFYIDKSGKLTVDGFEYNPK